MNGPTSASWQWQVKRAVRSRYARMAGGDGVVADGARRAREAGYPSDWVDGLSPAVASAYAGCGYALEDVDLKGVVVVVDLGCGAGLDVRLVAEQLEPSATVIGVDLALPMLSHVLADEARQVCAGFSPTARIAAIGGDMENLPLADGIADLVLANASLNLTVDKRAALAEALRVLRPGGRLVARDLIRAGELPRELAQDPMAWNASLGGVLEAEVLIETVREAGFGAVRISNHRPFSVVQAVRLEATKPLDGDV